MTTNIQAFTEVNMFIKAISENKKSKIPKKLRNLFEEKSDSKFEKHYNINQPLYTQGITREALSIIALLHINYWCENEQEKNEIWKLLKLNEQKNEEEKKKKYSIENMFNSRNTKEVIDINSKLEAEQNKTDVIVYKENIFVKIINKIKYLFRK